MEVIEKYVKDAARKIKGEIYEDKYLIESFIILCSELEQFVIYDNLKVTHENNSIRDSLIKDFYYEFTKRANEFLLAVLVMSRISAAAVLRTIIEKFVIFHYLSKASKDEVYRYLIWSSMEIKREENSNDLKEIIKKIEDDVDIYLEGETDEKKNKIKKQLYKNKYGWAYRYFKPKDRITFASLCKKVELETEYYDFDKLSNPVHSNRFADSLLNSIFGYEEVVYYLKILLDLIEYYINDYVKRYKIPKKYTSKIFKAIKDSKMQEERAIYEQFYNAR